MALTLVSTKKRNRNDFICSDHAKNRQLTSLQRTRLFVPMSIKVMAMSDAQTVEIQQILKQAEEF